LAKGQTAAAGQVGQNIPILGRKTNLLFSLLKSPARLAFLLYCRHIRIRNKAMLRLKGPLLIAANHPNSFFDAIVLATLFRQPIHSLARGDAFKKPFFAKLLASLNILPVYRVTEGVENLEHNYTTFDRCREIFKQGGIVLIFSEGRCINEWHLRPLMKGTARLALSSWQEGIPLQVLPTGINYSSFVTFGKNIQLGFGRCIQASDIPTDNGQGKSIAHFNRLLQAELDPLVVQIHRHDRQQIRAKLGVRISSFKKILLALPAALGWLAHAPLYLPLKRFSLKKAAPFDHHDSVMMGLLFILYPFYLLLLSAIAFFITGSVWAWGLLVLLPFCAWAYVQVKHQFED
jgi:1-acyl-sn-glycerol-3-phosphate acyltransferase